MKGCPQCGRENFDKDLRCDRCGSPLPTSGPRPERVPLTIWPLLGAGSWFLGLIAAGVLFMYLPPGRYPYAAIGLPAVPFLYLGFWCFKRDGLVRARRAAEPTRAITGASDDPDVEPRR